MSISEWIAEQGPALPSLDILRWTLVILAIIFWIDLMFVSQDTQPILVWTARMLRHHIIPFVKRRVMPRVRVGFRRSYLLAKKIASKIPNPVVVAHRIRLKLNRVLPQEPISSQTRLELSIEPGYVDWDLWACIRELFQNAKDADDLGMKMRFDLDSHGTLRITNQGAKLTRQSLVLGGTTKRGTEQRGQFGEGYKLAFATLLKSGRAIKVWNQDEIWTPRIEQSMNFNSEVLVIHIEPAPEDTISDELTVEIRGISRLEFAAIKTKLLFDRQQEFEDCKVDEGILLKTQDLASKVFVKGIFVSSFYNPHFFGYDLFRLKLNRDRTLADPLSMGAEIMAVLESCLQKKILSVDALYEVLEANFGELDAVAAHSNSYLHQLPSWIAQAFARKHGDSAIPVSSNRQKDIAYLLGRDPVFVDARLLKVLERGGLQLDALNHSEDTDKKRSYEFHELSEREAGSLTKALLRVRAIEPWVNKNNVKVVDFIGPKIRGVYRGLAEINLARKILSDDKVTVATLVHEAAHKYGDDGTAYHREGEERIFSAIIGKMENEIEELKSKLENQ